jgi:predicted ester cyclase
VFTQGNVTSMDRCLRGDAFQGRVAELVARWRTLFPDFRIEVGEVIVHGDRVVTVETLSGTHGGVFDSRLGPVHPTGRSVRWSRISIRTLDGDRFVDGFFEEDEVGLLAQLGVLGITGVGRGMHSPIAPERDAVDG